MEKNLKNPLGNKYDIVVFDEIHNLSNKQFGNYLTLVTIAESGLFGSTIFEAADTLLYDAFNHLNAIAARDKFLERLRKNTIK